MLDKWVLGLIGGTGVLLTLARRIHNSEPAAGQGAAAWTLIVMLFYVFFGLLTH